MEQIEQINLEVITKYKPQRAAIRQWGDMHMRKKAHIWDRKLTTVIMGIVLLLIIAFFSLTSNSIVTLTKRNILLRTEYCADRMNTWTGSVIDELKIYKHAIEEQFIDDPEALEAYVRSTYGIHDAYPMGLYLADENGFAVDAAEWEKGSDWVPTERPWFIDGKESYHFVYGEPYVDAMLDQICISVSARLRTDGPVCVLAADIYLDHARKLINELCDNANIDGAIFVTKDNHIVLADSRTGQAGNRLEDGDGFSQQLNALLSKDETQYTITNNHTTYYVTIADVPETDWHLITYAKKNTVLRFLYELEFFMALFAVIAAAILALFTQRYAKQMVAVQNKARKDRLTGIYNREGFDTLMYSALEKANGHGALIIIDLDNFKNVNDTLGHPEGDRLLVGYARLLEQFFNRKNDLVARIGGDEFVVFIGREVSVITLRAMLLRFMDQMHTHFDKEYAGFGLSASMGVAIMNKDESYSVLYRRADAVLYEVKRGGKRGFCIDDGETPLPVQQPGEYVCRPKSADAEEIVEKIAETPAAEAIAEEIVETPAAEEITEKIAESPAAEEKIPEKQAAPAHGAKKPRKRGKNHNRR